MLRAVVTSGSQLIIGMDTSQLVSGTASAREESGREAHAPAHFGLYGSRPLLCTVYNGIQCSILAISASRRAAMSPPGDRPRYAGHEFHEQGRHGKDPNDGTRRRLLRPWS